MTTSQEDAYLLRCSLQFWQCNAYLIDAYTKDVFFCLIATQLGVHKLLSVETDKFIGAIRYNQRYRTEVADAVLLY